MSVADNSVAAIFTSSVVETSRASKRVRPGDGSEVSVTELERHCPALEVVGAKPAANRVGHSYDLEPESLRVVHVGREGLFVTDRFHGAPGDYGSVVSCPGEVVKLCAEARSD